VLDICDKIVKTLLAIEHLPQVHNNNNSNNSNNDNSKFGKQLSVELDYALKRLLNGIISTVPSS
jgi:hypothetical protein